jgi:hypothetical protein
VHPAQASEVARWAATVILGTMAIGFELRTKLIPNWLTLGGLVPVLALAFLTNRLGDALEGWLLAGAVGVWLFGRQVLAGGGVKTAALLGAAAGVGGGGALAIAGLLFGAGVLLWQRFSRPEKLWPAVPSSPISFVTVLVGLAIQVALSRAA